jgi:hypothetical protein
MPRIRGSVQHDAGAGVWRRMSGLVIVLAAVLVSLAASPAFAADPDFKLVGETATGKAFTSNFPATTATLAFRTAFDALGRKLGAKPVLQSAVGNKAGDSVQGFFKGTNQGTPVRGVLTASVGDGNAGIAVIFERADAFPQSLAALSKKLAPDPAASAAPAGSGAPAAAQLTPTKLSDGGEIGLAAGWRVTAVANGAVDLTNGVSSVSLGANFHVMVRGSGKGLGGPYQPPWPALQSVIDMNTHGGVRRGDVTVKLVEQLPPPTGFSGEVAKMTFDITQAGNTTRGLALVATSRISADEWHLYVSMATAPSARFAQELPTLQAMWHSWKLSPQVVKDRQASINRSEHEIADMKRSSVALKTRAAAIGALGADQYLRDVETIQNVTTGWKGDCDSHYSQAVVDGLNKAGGNYRIVPPSELVP